MSARLFLSFMLRDIKENLSYRAAFFVDLAAILSNILTFFFIQKLMLEAGHDSLPSTLGPYFPFVLIGIAFTGIQSASLSAVSNALLKEQAHKTLEPLLLCRVPVGIWLTASSGWSYVWSFIRVFIYFLIAACFFNFRAPLINWPAAVLLTALLVFTLTGVGLWSTAYLLVYKRGDPVSFIWNAASRFLSGVYFPVILLPGWLQKLGALLPLTHALEGLRKAILMGYTIEQLRDTVIILAGFSAVLLASGTWALQKAFLLARRRGTLSLQ